METKLQLKLKINEQEEQLAKAYVFRGHAQFGQGKYYEALDSYTKAIERYDLDLAYRAIGFCLLYMRRKKIR